MGAHRLHWPTPQMGSRVLDTTSIESDEPAKLLVPRSMLADACANRKMAEQVWEGPYGPTAIVASEQDTNGRGHDGDQAQRPGHDQEPLRSFEHHVNFTF